MHNCYSNRAYMHDYCSICVKYFSIFSLSPSLLLSIPSNSPHFFVFSIRSELRNTLSVLSFSHLIPLASTIADCRLLIATDRWSLHRSDCFPLFLVIWSMSFRLNGVDLAFVWDEWDFGYLGWFSFLLGWMGFRVCGLMWSGEFMMFGWMGWWWWKLVVWWWRLVCWWWWLVCWWWWLISLTVGVVWSLMVTGCRWFWVLLGL